MAVAESAFAAGGGRLWVIGGGYHGGHHHHGARLSLASGVGRFGARATGVLVIGVPATGVPAIGVPATGDSGCGRQSSDYAAVTQDRACGSKANSLRRRTPPPVTSNHESERAAMVVLVRQLQGYYPYVSSCAEGWQRVAPQPTPRRAMSIASKLIVIGAVAALTGCVTVPTGPTYSAMPGSRKSFDQFQVRRCVVPPVRGASDRNNAE